MKAGVRFLSSRTHASNEAPSSLAPALDGAFHFQSPISKSEGRQQI
jgi:hypothetical protein